MKERKVWNNEQDRVLKLLIEERGMKKWALISEVMEKEFLIHGRNGKQCRQRYHNHLDKNISNEEWTHQEQNTLFDMQDQYGNKWALIASKLPGRSDNCIKNHFYSKLRKGLRKVNKKIHKYLKKEYKDIKTATLYRVIETMENRNKGNNIQQETLELCRKIKNKLRQYDDSSTHFQDQNDQNVYLRVLIEELAFFDRDIRKSSKKGSLKSSLLSDQPPSPVGVRVSAKLSTKSMYDEQEESEYSNSDLFSSSSFDHKSFCSMRSNRSHNKSPSKEHLKPQRDLFRSQSIASQSENDSDPEMLCKSANSYVHHAKAKPSLQRAQLTNSLSLPLSGMGLRSSWRSSSMKLPSPDFTKAIDNKEVQTKRQESQKASSSSKSKHSINQAQNQNQIFFSYMMGEEPFQMRLFSPKRLTVEEKIEMSNQDDELFCGQNMQIESSDLVHDMNGLSINDIPTLSRNRDL